MAAVRSEDEPKLRGFVDEVRDLFSKGQLLRRLYRDETLAQYLSSLIAAPRTSAKLAKDAEAQPASKRASKPLPNNARSVSEAVAATEFLVDNKLQNSELSRACKSFAKLLDGKGHADAAADIAKFSGAASTTIHEMELVDRLTGLLQRELLLGAHSVMLQGDGGSVDGVGFNVWTLAAVVDAEDAPPMKTAGYAQALAAERERSERRPKPENYCPTKRPPADDTKAAYHDFQASKMKDVMARLRDARDLNPFGAASSELAAQWSKMPEADKAPFVAAGRSANEAKAEKRKEHATVKATWEATQKALPACVV
jgi:hypothetical protein